MKNEWTYVKDRLPEHSTPYVIVTLAFDDGVRIMAMVAYSARYKKFNANDYDDGDNYAFGDEVLAWMPAPDKAEVMGGVQDENAD